jgi:enamine deaminase RidA (YjgF/YER057c/UK114 family)
MPDPHISARHGQHIQVRVCGCPSAGMRNSAMHPYSGAARKAVALIEQHREVFMAATDRLKELGITLPTPPAPVASYVPFAISGNQVFISGQIPLKDGKLSFVGKVGADIRLKDAQDAAKLCAINLLAQLNAACDGNLERVRRCLKLGVFVNAAPDFTRQSEVANGASDLMVAVLGDAGRHTRAAVGVASLPLGVAVEVDAVFEIS